MENINAPLVSGSNLKVWDDAQITDASPARESIINTQALSGFMIDIITDKGCTVSVTPLLSLDEDVSVGPTVELGSICEGGGTNRFPRMLIASPRTKVTVTKTEAGDSTSYRCSIRGIAEDVGIPLQRGAVPVVVQDQVSPVFILPMVNQLGASTLTVQAVIDGYSVTVASAAGMTVGDHFRIINALGDRYYAGTIIDIVANVLTLDTPLDAAYIVGSEATYSNINMAISNGAVTPVVYKLRTGSPSIPSAMEVTRMIITCVCTSAIDLSLFGNIPALVRGLVLRHNNGKITNIFNVKTNQEIANIMYDLNVYASTNPQQGVDGFTARLTFASQGKMGVAIRIEENENLEMLVQDNMAVDASLTSLFVILEGHVAATC